MSINSDSVIIVTGASKGIGRATALAFARAGAHALAVARSVNLLERLEEEAAGLPGEIVAMPADVTQREQVEAVVKTAVTQYGCVDVLVNNAGIERVKPLDDVTDADYAATIDTNLKGVFLFTRAVVSTMKDQRSGLIINVASTAGVRGFANDAIYCASKFGVVGFTDALDEELREFGIRVTCVSPGAVNTELAKDTWSPPDDPYRPHFLQPEDLAAMMLFIASQPPRVTIPHVHMRPLVEPPYSSVLPLEDG